MSADAEDSATHSIFHWKTAQLISIFLHQNKLKPSVVENETLKALCKHLNVLMEMPTAEMIESANFAAGYEPKDDDLSSTCIWCGLEVSKPLSYLLSEKNAATILTAAVIDNQKTLKQAKKAILNDKLYLCESHINPMREAMIDVLGGESNREIRRIPAYSFLVGLVFFNKLMKIRKVYVEEEFTETAEVEYRKLVANLLTKDIPRVPAKESRNYQRSVKRKDNTVTVSQPAPTATATAIVSEPLGDITQTVEDGDIPDLKKVKLEEEEYNETEATTPSTSSSLAPTFQQPVQKQPTLLPSNMRIYTLKNGKKVVKAPVILKSAQAALAKTSGKLVTVRVARRRVIRSAAKETESEVEKKPENLL
ncbi:unnamed protein product [Caenorhabditis nigoni]